MGGALEKIVFNSADLPGDERLRREKWVDSLSSGYVRLRADFVSEKRFNGELKIAMLKDVSIGSLCGTVRNISRTVADVAVQNTDNVVLLFNNSSNVTRIEQKGALVDCLSGEAVMIEQCEPSTIRVAEQDDCNLVAIQAPRGQIRAKLLDLENRFMARVPARSTAMALARAYIDILLDQNNGSDPLIARFASDHITDFIAAALDSEGVLRDEQVQGLRTGRLVTIRRELDQSYMVPSYSLTTLARHLAVTPRYLQKLLAEVGTSFSDELTKRRLDRAQQMLASSRHLHMNVADIAYECGFLTVSHFHRVFRRRFGMTPGELRETARRRIRD